MCNWNVTGKKEFISVNVYQCSLKKCYPPPNASKQIIYYQAVMQETSHGGVEVKRFSKIFANSIVEQQGNVVDGFLNF